MRFLLTIISIATLLCCGAANATAQGIRGKSDLKKFYKEFFNNKSSRDSLVKACCTDSLYQAWKVNSLDSPFVKGSCNIYNGVQITRWPKSNQYLVSFGGWQLEQFFDAYHSVAVHVKNGKIYNVDRPQITLSTSQLNGTRWKYFANGDTCSNWAEFKGPMVVWHNHENKVDYLYYLTDTIPSEFDMNKVGQPSKGRYLVQYSLLRKEFLCNSFIFFNRKKGCMAEEYPNGKVKVYIMPDKFESTKPLKSIEFPVNGPKRTTW